MEFLGCRKMFSMKSEFDLCRSKQSIKDLQPTYASWTWQINHPIQHQHRVQVWEPMSTTIQMVLFQGLAVSNVQIWVPNPELDSELALLFHLRTR